MLAWSHIVSSEIYGGPLGPFTELRNHGKSNCKLRIACRVRDSPLQEHNINTGLYCSFYVVLMDITCQ